MLLGVLHPLSLATSHRFRPADAQQLSAKAKIRLWRRILTDEKSWLEYSDLALPHVIRGESRRVAEERGRRTVSNV